MDIEGNDPFNSSSSMLKPWGEILFKETPVMLVLELQNGIKHALSYSYMTEVSFLYENQPQSINMTFSETMIFVKGYRLQEVFEKLTERKLKRLICQDTRYQVIADQNEPVVLTISVLSKEH